MTKWTDKQQAAIDHDCAKDGNAIVSAAAGSGKTAVLVERIIRLLSDEENKMPADKIAAVTFTVKAADELRVRLQKALAGKIAKSNSEWLEEQLIRLEDAEITTINSFCLSVVRRYAEEIGYSRDFRISDESESGQFSDKALKAAMTELYEDGFSDDERTELFGLFGKAGDSGVKNAILTLERGLVKLPRPKEQLIEKAGYYEHPEKLYPLLAEPQKAGIKEKIKRALALAQSNVQMTTGSTAEGRSKNDLALFTEWDNADLSSPDEVERLLYGKVESGIFTSKSLEGFREELKENHAEYKELLTDIKDTAAMIISFDAAVLAQAKGISALCKLYGRYDTLCSELKHEADCMSFSDSEHFCYELLTKDGGRIASELDSAFMQIIVDEFQDCNRLQCEIFAALNKSGNKLFYVGDVKQLIYRFRSSDPKIFTDTVKNPDFMPLILNKNFRSSEEVVSAVNELFTGLMTEEAGGVLYDKDSRLECGLGISGGDEYTAELILIAGEYDGEDGAEAAYVAKRIKEMKENGFLIADKANGLKKRRVRYGDFAVITSALTPVEKHYINAFEKCGVPYIRGGKGDFASLGETEVMTDLLKIIDNPYRDIELLNVMMSPIYRFTADEMASLRFYSEQEKEKKHSALFDDVTGYKNDDALKKKLDGFLSDLAYWQGVCKRSSVSKLILSICMTGAFEPLAAASKSPEKAYANLRLLQRYSESYAEISGGTLSGFVDFLIEAEQSDQKMEEADVAGDINDGAVNLLTIHASKGLEFPICFVVGMGREFNKKETSVSFLFDDEIGFAAQYVDSGSFIRYRTLSFKHAADKIKQASFSEEIRKLYVAATRARDKLIFTAYTKKEDGGTPKNCYYGLIDRQADRAFKRTVIKAEELPTVQDEMPAEITEETAAEFSGKTDIPYEREILTKIPRKLTATQIGVLRGSFMDDDDEPGVFPRNPSFLKSTGLSGKKRGDAYHKAMEIIDFKKGDYAKQLSAMREFFTDEEFNAVDSEKIIAFFNSPLGKRAVKSERVEKEFQLYTELRDLTEIGLSAEVGEKFSERPLIQGIADMFFYENDKIVLVDYKTNTNTSEEKLTAEYQKQLSVYKQAISEMTGDEVKECYIYSFELGEIKITI